LNLISIKLSVHFSIAIVLRWLVHHIIARNIMGMRMMVQVRIKGCLSVASCWPVHLVVHMRCHCVDVVAAIVVVVFWPRNEVVVFTGLLIPV